MHRAEKCRQPNAHACKRDHKCISEEQKTRFKVAVNAFPSGDEHFSKQLESIWLALLMCLVLNALYLVSDLDGTCMYIHEWIIEPQLP